MNRPNGRHELFCREYVRRPVGSAAAIAAGYGEDNAAGQACRLLARPDIQARIAALREEVAARQVADSNAVLARLQSIYELALEQNQLNTALRAVAMQLKVSEAIPAWRKAARPAPAAATPDFDAMLAALEASLPPEVTAQGEAPAMPDAPSPALPDAPSPALPDEPFPSRPPGPDAARAREIPPVPLPGMPINANKSQPSDTFFAARAAQSAPPGAAV
ncbi:MAG: terminase small subunit [Alphaproteobacteria bacterium]